MGKIEIHPVWPVFGPFFLVKLTIFKIMDIKFSQADVVRLNQGKRRSIDPFNHKDEVAKRNRNSGDPYRGRDGHLHPGILPPSYVSMFYKIELLCTKNCHTRKGVAVNYRFFWFAP